MKSNPNPYRQLALPIGLMLAFSPNVTAEPLVSSWYTEEGGSYARIWQSITDEITEKEGGTVTSVTTWDADLIEGRPMIGAQTSPVYAGIQGVSYSTDYVYVKATGLAVHTMGPWYDDAEKTQAFPSFPANAAILYRFPRDISLYGPDYVSPQRVSGLGTNGLSVDGVPIFNSSDGSSYEDEGVWNQDAFFNEGRTFDSGNAHQAATAYHYHANPAGLRNRLGDSVDYDPSVVFTGLVVNGGNNPYTESPNGMHSPIIGWVNDGLPIYGPYGYSDPTDPNSSVRRMISGYQMRDGSNGSYDLPANGRDLLPQWSVDLNGANSTTPASDGPAVVDEGRYILGTFIEDYAFKGDLVGLDLYQGVAIDGEYSEGTDYDLNQFNVRYCVTPEFPDGTWAYFTCIAVDGTPVYPYNIGNNYFGDSNLAAGVEAIDEAVTVVFDGGATKEAKTRQIDVAGTEITIVWDGVEGGIYRVDTSTDLATWTEGTEFVAEAQEFSATDTTSLPRTFYRLIQTGLSEFDDTEFSTGGGGGPGGGGPGGGGPGGGPP